ncbi:hypothetical protein N4Q63_26825 [Leclercia adecarboxylata]|uniref:hypothetical protein n=1 Tax=Leclercia adecarboxylata TaxID=83655 RepID=UPI00234DDAE7|nr:hypothetical protein [Leclercia adecarboxylata]
MGADRWSPPHPVDADRWSALHPVGTDRWSVRHAQRRPGMASGRAAQGSAGAAARADSIDQVIDQRTIA